MALRCADDLPYPPTLTNCSRPTTSFLLDGPGYFTRDDFFDYYCDVNGVARWCRGTGSLSGPEARKTTSSASG